VHGAVRLEVPRTVLPAAQVALAVELRRGSEAEKQVSAAAQAGRRTTPEVAALVARLAAGARPPLAGHVTERGQLILTVDMAALTRDLVDRLGRRADVEYAQPSHVVRPLGGDAR
jgi:porphobilinogen deaminase